MWTDAYWRISLEEKNGSKKIIGDDKQMSSSIKILSHYFGLLLSIIRHRKVTHFQV